MADQEWSVWVDDAGFCQRVGRYLDGTLGPTEFAEFNAELRDEAGKREAFVRICFVRVALFRSGASARAADDLAAVGGLASEPWDASVQPDALLDDAMILPALRDSGQTGGNGGEANYFLPREAFPTSRPSRNSPGLWRAVAALVATVIGLAAVWGWFGKSRAPVAVAPQLVPDTSRPPSADLAPVVVVTATAGSVFDGRNLVPGTALSRGQALGLTSGAVELTVSNGATVLVRGPARIRVTDGNTLALDAGSLYAHVPPPARGFRVTAPGLDVVDLGTDFGVRTGPDGTSAEVHVFLGRVRATAVDAEHRPTAPGVVVATDTAVGHAQTAAAQAPQSCAFAATAFDREIAAVRLPLPAHGTGVDLAAGTDDPAWQIVSVPGRPDWQPRPAGVVDNPRQQYARNTPLAKWISTSARMGDAESGEYTYRTTLDLSGYDLATVSVGAELAADDRVAAVRVNGVGVRLPSEIIGFVTPTSVALTDVPWHDGSNQIEVVVFNNPRVGTNTNYTGLRVALQGSACAIVRR